MPSGQEMDQVYSSAPKTHVGLGFSSTVYSEPIKY